LKSDIERLLPTTTTTVLAAKWASTAGDINGTLQTHRIPAGVACAVAVPGYIFDNTRSTAFTEIDPYLTPLLNKPFSIVAHSRGCHVLLQWLYVHRHYWNDTACIALLHPDTPRGYFGGNDAWETVQDFEIFAKEKIGVFDTAWDHATLLGGKITNFETSNTHGDSRCHIGDLCAHHHQLLRANGLELALSHNAWLPDDAHRVKVVQWIVDHHG
jgi:hypothetical protein